MSKVDEKMLAQIASMVVEQMQASPAVKDSPEEKKSVPLEDPSKVATYELNYPILVKGNQINRIVLRRPKYGDLELAISQSRGNSSDIGKNLLCNLGGLTHDEFRELDIIDYTRLSKMAKTFFVGGETETILQEIGLE